MNVSYRTRLYVPAGGAILKGKAMNRIKIRHFEVMLGLLGILIIGGTMATPAGAENIILNNFSVTFNNIDAGSCTKMSMLLHATTSEGISTFNGHKASTAVLNSGESRKLVLSGRRSGDKIIVEVHCTIDGQDKGATRAGPPCSDLSVDCRDLTVDITVDQSSQYKRPQLTIR